MGVKISEALRTGTSKAVAICILAVLLAGCEAPSSTITIAPASIFLSTGKVTTVSFTVSGGNGNYVWAMSNASMGTLSTANGSAMYQNNSSQGTNVITVSDTASNSASAVITQQ